MFSIYGITGQVFSGSLEQMNRIRSLSNARALRGVAQDGAELSVERMTVSDSDDVAAARRTLRDNHIHQAPVLDASAQLVGIVSERDLFSAVNIDAGQIVETLGRRVRNVITTQVFADPPLSLWR